MRKQDVLAYLEDGGRARRGAAEPPMHIESPYRPEPAAPRAPKPPAAATAAPPQPQPAPAPPPPGAAPPQPAPTAEPPVAAGHGEPLSRMRKSIGEHMRRSLETAAHCTTIVEAT